MKIISKKPVSIAEVKEILRKEKEGKKEKTKEAEKAEKAEKVKAREREHKIAEAVLEYANKFAKISAEKVVELKEKIKASNIAKLSDEYIVKIIDVMPEDFDDIRKIFVGADIDLDQNEMQKILDIIAEYKK